jgi:hypothetical protein
MAKESNKIYGSPPVIMDEMEFDTDEMMFWLYCPVKVPGGCIKMPKNLEKYKQLIKIVCCDDEDVALDKYIYLTAKTLFVNPENLGNRHGWHSDGFLTDDINYIWYDRNPTIFWVPDQKYTFTEDHEISMREMHDVAEGDYPNYVTYPCKTLLRLNQTVIHKVNPNIEPGMRTFVKVSVSIEKYTLKGNSINHELPEFQADYVQRKAERNCPIGSCNEIVLPGINIHHTIKL